MPKSNMDIVLDCADPKALGEFWRQALGYKALWTLDDLVVDDILPEVERLEALGGRRLHEGIRSLGTSEWVTMADPEDNEFCVCTGVEW